MTAPLRYGRADTFLTEEEVSPPASVTTTSRALLSDESSHSFEVAPGGRAVTVGVARSEPWWLYGTVHAAQRLSALAENWRLCSIRPANEFTIIGGTHAIVGMLDAALLGPIAEPTLGPPTRQNPAETTFIVYGAMDAPLTPSVPANMCAYGLGFLSAAAPAVDPAARVAAFGMAEPRDSVASFVEPLRSLTEQLEQRTPFEAPVKVRMLAELALRRLAEHQQDDIDRWARHLIDGLPDADD